MSLTKLFSDNTAVAAKRERRKEARPGELLDAALDLFVEKGFAATRAEEVAARAGVSKGTLFLYFPSKEELFKAVVRENISGRFAEWNEEFDVFEGTTADMVRYCMNRSGGSASAPPAPRASPS
jgi:TetR/AcrR family transcriptional regulator